MERRPRHPIRGKNLYCVLPPYAPAAATPLSTPPTLLCVLFMKAMKKTKQLAEGGPRGLHSCLSDESLCRFCFRPVLYGQKKKCLVSTFTHSKCRLVWPESSRLFAVSLVLKMQIGRNLFPHGPSGLSFQHFFFLCHLSYYIYRLFCFHLNLVQASSKQVPMKLSGLDNG